MFTFTGTRFTQGNNIFALTNSRVVQTNNIFALIGATFAQTNYMSCSSSCKYISKESKTTFCIIIVISNIWENIIRLRK
jgi:hypothetical protein